MKILFKEQKNIPVFKVFIDGKESKWTISKQNYLTDVYYLIYYGKRLKRRVSSVEECQQYLKGEILNEMADMLIKEQKK